MIILASASPRRKHLMEEITSSFKVVVSEIDESLSFHKYQSVRHIIKDISLRKCEAVAKDYPNDIVVSADTVVVIDKQISSKPKDSNDAYCILRNYQKKTLCLHSLYYQARIGHANIEKHRLFS